MEPKTFTASVRPHPRRGWKANAPAQPNTPVALLLVLVLSGQCSLLGVGCSSHKPAGTAVTAFFAADLIWNCSHADAVRVRV